ncbi:DUF2752 domain-containing protein [soil metagenome]
MIRWILALVGVGGLLLVYRQFNPYEVDFLPRCPFQAFTGFTCPGCGSQRSLHFLLHLEVVTALRENALLVLSLPYLLTYGLFRLSRWDQRRPSLRKALFGPRAIQVILLVIVLFWIGRNAWAASRGEGSNPLPSRQAHFAQPAHPAIFPRE